MQISADEQESTDFDWFCVDKLGQIGHFTTAGFKRLPKSSAENAEKLKLVTDFFQSAEPICEFNIDQDLSREVNDPNERYLLSFTAMASRGLYSFDIAPYLQLGIAYFRVAIPKRPTLVEEIPESIGRIITRTALPQIEFRNTSRIPYADTTSI